MESLKPILLLAVLGGVGYGVYVALNKHQPQARQLEEAPAWNEPKVELGTPDGKPPRELAPRDRSRSSLAGTNRRRDSESARTAMDRDTTGHTPATSDPFSNLPENRTEAPRATTLGAVHSPAPVESTSTNPPPAFNPPAVAGDRYSGTPLGDSPSLVPASGVSPIVPPTSESAEHREYEAAKRRAETALGQNKLVDALRELTPWYANAALSSEEQSQLVDLLGQLAGSVVYSREHWLTAPHVVRDGESVETIAQQHQIPWQLLAKINGIDDPNSLHPGEELKVVPGPFHGELSADQQWLTLYVDNLYAGRFRVHARNSIMGSDSALPVAKVPADHPTNAVRCRYISLGGSVLVIDTDGIERGTIPPPGSAGWMRLDPRDMDDVYNILSDRSQVTLRR